MKFIFTKHAAFDKFAMFKKHKFKTRVTRQLIKEIILNPEYKKEDIMKQKQTDKNTHFPQFTYEKEDDILMIELNNKKIDYAEQSGDLIVHFSPKREAVLLEILDASHFFAQESKILPKEIKQKFFGISA